MSGRIPFEGGEGEELSAVLGRHQDNWPRRGIDKLGLYEVDGIRHHLGLDIEMARGDRGKSESAIFSLEAHSFSGNERMRTQTRNKQIREFTEIQSILSDLAISGISGRIHCHLAWNFPPDSIKPIVALPMMTFQSVNVPFTEIVGVRMTRPSDEGLTSVTIDLRPDRSTFVILVLPPVRANISDDLLNSTVRNGSLVIQEFIFKPDDFTRDEGVRL